MTAQQVRDLCAPEAGAKALLEQAIQRLGISARAYDRLLKVARTIADLAAAECLDPPNPVSCAGAAGQPRAARHER